jgi:methylmalonyl-CoA mutase
MREELNILNDFPATPHDEWLAAVEKQLKGKPFEKALVKKTYEGIDIQPMYFKHDLDHAPQARSLPGFAPCARGTRASGHRFFGWRIAQEITEPTPDQFGEALANDLRRGQNAINIRLDRAAMAGLDPDNANPGDVGAGGLSLATTRDWATVLGPIETVVDYPIQIETGPAALAVCALLAAHFNSQNLPLSQVKGCVAFDPLEHLLLTGTLPVSLAKSYDQMACLTRWARQHAPELKTIAVHGAPYANAGGNAVQEIAFAAAAGITYLREMQHRGLAVDDVCRRIQFHFSIGADFFMEIAKFRAARMVWQTITAAFGAEARSREMFIHAATLRYNKTRTDPWVNMLRVTTETFAGIAGGCDSLHVGPFDEVIRKPDAFSRRIARNVQILLKEEAHLDKVADPAGGSWYVERITLALAEKAWALIQDVEKAGGLPAALKAGFPQEQVAAVAALRAAAVATRKDRIVGTNMYPNLLEKKLNLDPPDPVALQRRRSRELAQFRQDRQSSRPADIGGEAIETAGGAAEAAMARLIDAAASGATLGDLTALLHGADRPERESIAPLHLHRRSEPYETLRQKTEAHRERTGRALKVFMANMGPLARHKPRSDFATAFFNVAAMETVFNDGFAGPAAAAEAALASGARAVVICGTDDDYMDTVVPVTAAIKAGDPGVLVIVAGYSPKYVDSFRQAGVDEFIHLKADALAVLRKLQHHLMSSTDDPDPSAETIRGKGVN